MKNILMAVTMIFVCLQSNASRVSGHMRKDGSYVQSYNRTKSDHSKANNYSSAGNVNPYTGKKGHKK